MDPFGTYLKRKRLDHNLALREVAAAAGASLPDVSAWENGRRRPKPGAQFLAMMNAYRIPNDAEAVVSALCEIPVLEPPCACEFCSLVCPPDTSQEGGPP